jgi:hypothetical protein
MKLLRLALFNFAQTPENWRTVQVLESDEGELQAIWESAQELADGSFQLLVGATVSLSERPVVNKNGLVIVPEGPLKEAEALIETSANLIAVSERCSRSISSPIPAVGFLPESQETRQWLDSTNGILGSRNAVVSTGGLYVDPETTLRLASDRPDGAALLAEALSHEHPTGTFHELLRVFERAFRLTSTSLIKPLFEFLDGSGMGYTEREVERWLTTLRHPATHADTRAEFVLESDIQPVIPRMMQAAYDVLFNKDGWRGSSTLRRDIWTPPVGTSADTSDFFATSGEPAAVQFELSDELGSYPCNLEVCISEEMIPEMWSKWPSEPDRDGQ